MTDVLQQAASEGREIVLPKGTFQVRETIRLGDNCIISGSGDQETTLVLGNNVNNNMFTNASHKLGNTHITLKNLQIDGNQLAQHRPEAEKRLSFCNIVYLANAAHCTFSDLSMRYVRQTALHFTRSRSVKVSKFRARDLGWSGISTSATSHLIATEFHIENAGNDYRHSAVHLDGGNGCFLSGVVRKCVGNGVMLDSTFAELKNCMIRVESYECMRGIALIGGDSQTHTVSIVDSIVRDNEIGIMVSNSHGAFIHGCRVEANSEVGILFQGRLGGFDSFVSGCTCVGNKKDISQMHESRNNLFVNNQFL